MFTWIARALEPSKDSRVHAGIAFVLAVLLVGLDPEALWAAWLVPGGFFYGREMRDAEIANPSLMTGIGRFLPWKWHEASQKEFLHPLLAAALPATIAGFLL